MMPKVRWGPGRNLLDPEMPIGFELHFRFWNEEVMRFRVADLDEFWNRRIQRQIDDLSFPCLHPVDSLGYTALNILRDLARGLLPIEQIHCVARFLHTQSKDVDFWESWKDLHSPSQRRLEAIPFQIATDWFGCQVPVEVQEETERLPASIHGWFRETSRSGLLPRPAQAKDGTWLHVLLLESSKDKLGVLREVLFGVGSTPQVEGSDVSEDHATDIELRSKSSRSFRRLLAYPTWFVSRSAVRLAKFPSFFRLGFRLWLSSFNLGKGFWSFFAGSFFFDLGMVIFFVLYNLYLLDRGYKENVLGLVASASAIGGIVGAIPAGTVCTEVWASKSTTAVSDVGISGICLAVRRHKRKFTHRARIRRRDGHYDLGCLHFACGRATHERQKPATRVQLDIFFWNCCWNFRRPSRRPSTWLDRKHLVKRDPSTHEADGVADWLRIDSFRRDPNIANQVFGDASQGTKNLSIATLHWAIPRRDGGLDAGGRRV